LRGDPQKGQAMLRELKKLIGKDISDKSAIFARNIESSMMMNPARLRIFTYLCRKPCSGFNVVCRSLGLKPPSAGWHLHKLATSGFVSRVEIGNRAVYMPIGMIRQDDIRFFTLLNRDKSDASTVLKFILEQPAVTLDEIVKISGTSRIRTARLLASMKKVGAVFAVKDGRFKRFYISSEMMKLLNIYRKREKAFKSLLVSMFRADGIIIDIHAIRNGTIILKLGIGRRRETVTFYINPVTGLFID
jgi:DNA-binding transcriptional ArsR family regulator